MAGYCTSVHLYFHEPQVSDHTAYIVHSIIHNNPCQISDLAQLVFKPNSKLQLVLHIVKTNLVTLKTSIVRVETQN